MKESRAKLFLENILIYGLGSAMNRIIPLIMLPIVIRLLPSAEYYGINDIITIFVSLGSAVAVMGMFDALYRFYFDKEDVDYRREVCSSTLFTLVTTGFIAGLAAFIFQRPLAGLLFSDYRFAPLIIIGGLNIWFTSINVIMAAPTRMQNQRLRYIVIQTLTPILGYSFAILLILKGEYVYALPVASLFSNVVVCIIFFVINRHFFKAKYFNIAILKPMLRFGIPLMPVFIFFWVMSSVGRIILTNTWGLEYTGLYAAAGKLAAVSQVIGAAFAGGWQYFAFSTMNDKDYVVLISKIFDYLAGISFGATAVLLLVLKPIYNIMLPAQYAEGLVVVPALFLAPLLLMLRQTIGMHFQVKKKTILGASTIGVGAAVSLVLYFILIPLFGIKGAAIASLSGYAATLLVTIVIFKKMKLILISKRFCVGFMLTVVLLMLHMNGVKTAIVHIMATFECIVLLIFYRIDGINLIKRVVKTA